MINLKVGLTEKRYMILNVLDKFGIVTVDQIVKLTSFNKSTIYYALREFEKKELIRKFKSMQKAVYLITKLGSEVIGDINFGFSKDERTPNFAIFRHAMLLNESVIFYKEHFSERAQFEVERELIAKFASEGLQRKKQIANLPDFVIEIEGMRQAVEVELTRKSPAKLTRKLLNYKRLIEVGEYTHLIYLYQSLAIRRLVAKCAVDVGVEVTFGNLDEMLGGNIYV